MRARIWIVGLLLMSNLITGVQAAATSGPSPPNDPEFPEQVALRQVRWDRFMAMGTPNNYGTTGSAVCVIDQAFNLGHVEFSGRILGLVTLSPGIVNARHGTSVAGIAVQEIGNVRGGAGVANVGVYFVRIDLSNGPTVTGSSDPLVWQEYYTQNIADAIRWCADFTIPRTVIHLSLGEAVPTPPGSTARANLLAAIDYAYITRGKLLVASTGNDNCVGAGCIPLPAAHPRVLTTGCYSRLETRCHAGGPGGSNGGPDLKLVAPSYNVVSPTYSGTTGHLIDHASSLDDGSTSYAAPHVSGLAALVWDANPTLTNGQVFNRLINTAVNLGPGGWDPEYGYGRIDVVCAMQGTAPCPRHGPSPPEDLHVVTTDSLGHVRLGWDRPATQGSDPIVNYVVESRPAGSALPYTEIGTTPHADGVLNFFFDDRTPPGDTGGNLYEYRVYAVNQGGLQSDPAGPVTATKCWVDPTPCSIGVPPPPPPPCGPIIGTNIDPCGPLPPPCNALTLVHPCAPVWTPCGYVGGVPPEVPPGLLTCIVDEYCDLNPTLPPCGPPPCNGMTLTECVQDILCDGIGLSVPPCGPISDPCEKVALGVHSAFASDCLPPECIGSEAFEPTSVHSAPLAFLPLSGGGFAFGGCKENPCADPSSATDCIRDPCQEGPSSMDMDCHGDPPCGEKQFNSPAVSEVLVFNPDLTLVQEILIEGLMIDIVEAPSTEEIFIVNVPDPEPDPCHPGVGTQVLAANGEDVREVGTFPIDAVSLDFLPGTDQFALVGTQPGGEDGCGQGAVLVVEGEEVVASIPLPGLPVASRSFGVGPADLAVLARACGAEEASTLLLVDTDARMVVAELDTT